MRFAFRFAESMVTIVATRGVPDSGHKDLRSCQNRLMAWAVPYYSVVSDVEMRDGCDIVVAETLRIPPEAVNPRIKNYGRLDFVAAMFKPMKKMHAMLCCSMAKETSLRDAAGISLRCARAD